MVAQNENSHNKFGFDLLCYCRRRPLLGPFAIPQVDGFRWPNAKQLRLEAQAFALPKAPTLYDIWIWLAIFLDSTSTAALASTS
jgi:hypothetical protein